MRGDHLTHQLRIIRAIESRADGLTISESANQEETGIQTIYRDLKPFQTFSFTEFIVKNKTLPPRLLIRFASIDEIKCAKISFHQSVIVIQ